MTKAVYVEEGVQYGDCAVGFCTDKGDKLVREFTSPYLAREFVNKIKRKRGYFVLFSPLFN